MGNERKKKMKEAVAPSTGSIKGMEKGKGKKKPVSKAPMKKGC